MCSIVKLDIFGLLLVVRRLRLRVGQFGFLVEDAGGTVTAGVLLEVVLGARTQVADCDSLAHLFAKRVVFGGDVEGVSVGVVFAGAFFQVVAAVHFFVLECYVVFEVAEVEFEFRGSVELFGAADGFRVVLGARTYFALE